MSTAHTFEYSKSSRAKCNGPAPCKGTPIGLGELRYGHITYGDYGEHVEWRHWGCVTPDILTKLSSIKLERVPGFNSLRADDQQKIHRAVVLKHIDISDVPDSAKAPDPALLDHAAGPSSSQPAAPSSSQPAMPSSSQYEMLSSSQPSSSQPPSSQPMPSSQSNLGGAPSQKKRKAAILAALQASQGASAGPAIPSTPGPSSASAAVVVRGNASPSRRLQGVRRVVQEDEGVEDNEPEESGSVEELYCQLKTNVVGVQYYNGLVGPGEQVRLVRQPQNQYDRNAIQVKNVSNVQIGHIPKQVAGKLAPLMDKNLVTVEGIMYDGNLTGFSYSLSMSLKFYAAANKRVQIEPLLIWATPGQRGFPKSNVGNTNHTVPGASQASRGTQSSSKAGASGAGPSFSASQAYAFSSGPAASQARGMTATQKATAEKQQAAQKAQMEAFARAQELKAMLSSLEKVDDEGRRSSLLDNLTAQGLEDILGLPTHADPPGRARGNLRVDLLRHQSQALQWCIQKENPVLPTKESDKPVQFWQYRKGTVKPFYFNLATKTPQEAPPMLGRGGLNADSMGLGKTLTMIALILATKDDIAVDHSQSTLIVVPLSIMSNWESQIKDHVVAGKLSYCVYYGTNRGMSAKELQKYDVVITTYQTVTGEHGDSAGLKDGEPAKKKKKTEKKVSLMQVKWKRVILDEAHQIRNPKTKMATAVCALTAQRRWGLSGTPIINSPKDLGSILTFLRICTPLDGEDMFKRLLLRPLKDGDPAGAELLRALMSSICIRRTKEMKDAEGNALVPLPPVEMTLIPVTLSDEARALYGEVEKLSQQRVERLMDGTGGVSSAQVQSNVLGLLTRMRQLALHPGLLPRDYLEQLRYAAEHGGQEAPGASIKLTAADRVRLQNTLAQMIEDNEECPICMQILDEPRITGCGHPFCLACISEVLSRDPKCPMDRRTIGPGDLIEPPPPTDLTQAPARRDEEDDQPEGLRSGPSDKINQLIHLLRLTPGNEKSLVFSQFTSFLDKIGETLEEEGIPYVRFDGQMSARRRQEVLERFCIPLPDDPIPVSTQDAEAEDAPRASRRRSKAAAIDLSIDDESMREDDGSDFAMSPDEGDDDDFIVDDDDDFMTSKRKKGKAKSQPKGKGKVSQAKRSNRIIDDLDFGAGEVNPKVLLISLKAGALGLNLTVANNVYLMDPWWQEGIESQAIDRCNRIGQKKPVHVYQLIAEDTVESKVIEIQERKKLLVKEAFSGIKNNETQRQKKEARLKDLIQLFGVRQQVASQSRD